METLSNDLEIFSLSSEQPNEFVTFCVCSFLFITFSSNAYGAKVEEKTKKKKKKLDG